MNISLGDLDWTEIRALDDGALGLVCRRCHNPEPLCTVDSGDSLSELVGVVEAHRADCDARRSAITEYAAAQS